MPPRSLPRWFSPRLASAFTLVGIIAVATALIAAFVCQFREASNKLLCASNLRQMGIAAHNHHNDFSKLPCGYYGPVRANGGSTNVGIADNLDRGPWNGCIIVMLP